MPGKSDRLDKAQYREVRNMKSDSVKRDMFNDDRHLVYVDLLDIAMALVLEKRRKGAKRSDRRLAVIQPITLNCAQFWLPKSKI